MIVDFNLIKDSLDAVRKVRFRVAGSSRMACVITFGCQQNEADSERIMGLCQEMGYELTECVESADLIILNTCAIREHAEDKVLSLIGNFKAYKARNPELIIGVCGCMAAKTNIIERLKKDFHYVNFTADPSAIDKIPQLVLNCMETGKRVFRNPPALADVPDIVENIPAVHRRGHRAWVSTMYGCNNFCTYCIVPYTRGRERSRSSFDILAECQAFVDSGAKEITLLGQNVNSYRSDINFANLLEKVAMIDGDFIIKFMTSHPKDTSDELIDVIARYTPKIAPYFHLPLQSGSDSILKAMNRTYNADKYLEIAQKLRQNVAGISLSTDIIVGFPGESDDDFEKTLSVVRRVEFDAVFAFLYSPRSGTPAASMEKQVERDVMDSRMKRLLAIQDEIALKRNQSYLNTEQRVLVDSLAKRGNGVYAAYTNTAKLVHFVSEKNVIGEFVNVKIDKVGPYEMFGTLVNKN